MSAAKSGNRADDDALMARFADGDPTAAREITGLYAPRVLRMAVHLLGSEAEAEEVTQETMLRLWKSAPDWRCGEARISTWLWIVASNLCVDALRRQRSVPIDDIPEPLDERSSAYETIMEKSRAEALKTALASLPKRQRLAVVLRHLEELPNPQIAEIMGSSVEAVESLVARGKKALRAALLSRKEELTWQ